MSAREINDETEIFTEALGASLAQGNLTVDQLKRQLEGGLAYVEALERVINFKRVPPQRSLTSR
jgi:sirohydrochlorin ferrochelatase